MKDALKGMAGYDLDGRELRIQARAAAAKRFPNSTDAALFPAHVA